MFLGLLPVDGKASPNAVPQCALSSTSNTDSPLSPVDSKDSIKFDNCNNIRDYSYLEVIKFIKSGQ